MTETTKEQAAQARDKIWDNFEKYPGLSSCGLTRNSDGWYVVVGLTDAQYECNFPTDVNGVSVKTQIVGVFELE